MNRLSLFFLEELKFDDLMFEIISAENSAKKEIFDPKESVPKWSFTSENQFSLTAQVVLILTNLYSSKKDRLNATKPLLNYYLEKCAQKKTQTILRTIFVALFPLVCSNIGKLGNFFTFKIISTPHEKFSNILTKIDENFKFDSKKKQATRNQKAFSPHFLQLLKISKSDCCARSPFWNRPTQPYSRC